MGSSLKCKNLLPFEHIRCFNPLLTTETRERVIGIESHYMTSDLALHCLLTGFSIKNRIKETKLIQHPSMTNGLVQHITVEESSIIQWDKEDHTCLEKQAGSQNVVTL